jgi:hypothetical protein
MFWNFISSLPMKRGGSLSFLTIFHFCHSRVIGLDMTENRIFTLCRMITWVVFLRMFCIPYFHIQLVLLWAQLTKIYTPLPTSVQPISITKTLLIVLTKNEMKGDSTTGVRPRGRGRRSTQCVKKNFVWILVWKRERCWRKGIKLYKIFLYS